MISRRALLALAGVAALVAGLAFLLVTQRASVVVAARDLDGTRPLVADDLTTRPVPLDARPEGAVVSINEAIGRVPRAPVARGQLLIAAWLLERPAAFASGLVAPVGSRAVAIPVGPAQALGGAVSAGARVDVIAIPAQGKAPPGRPVELVGAGLLVLDVRTETGHGVPRASARPGVLASERIGSVVVAIPAQDELRLADRIGTSTFLLLLASDPALATGGRP